MGETFATFFCFLAELFRKKPKKKPPFPYHCIFQYPLTNNMFRYLETKQLKNGGLNTLRVLILVINSEKFRKMVGFGPTMRHQEEKRRRIVDVDTMASPNQAVDLRTTPGIIVFGPLSSSPRMASDPVENRFENFGPTIALGTRPAPNRLPKRSENSHTASSGAAPRLARFWRFYEPPSARYASAQSETAVFGYRR